MSIAKVCDICGVLYNEYNTKNEVKKPNGITLLNIDSSMEYWSHKPTDCCPNCMESILTHIESLKGE